MDMSSWLVKALACCDASPLAGKDEEYDRSREQLHALKRSVESPLRVAFLGEVKAGKSSVVNALIGERIAPTDVLEATAVVSVIRHGDPAGVIHFRDGRCIQGTFEDTISALEKGRGSEEFADTVHHVEVSLPLPGLESLEVLDTPGLTTMSNRIGEAALELLTGYDVVVWVFNSRHAGARDVGAIFERVAATKVPVVCVVSRVDELGNQESVERVLEYFSDQVLPWSDHVLATSVVRHERGEDGGMSALRAVLEGFGEAPEEAKVRSVVNRVDAVLAGLVSLHLDRAEAGEIGARTREAVKGRLIRAGQAVDDDVNRRVMSYIDDEMFRAEQARLRNQVKTGMTHGADLAAELEAVAIRCQGSIEEELSGLRELAAEFAMDAWAREGEKIHDYLEGLEGEELGRRHSSSDMQLANVRLVPRGTEGSSEADQLARPVAVTSAGATAFAAWAAWFGPAAATVGLGTALATIVPPVAIATAVGAGVNLLIKRGAAKSQSSADVDSFFDELRQRFRSLVWDGSLRPLVRERTQSVVQGLLQSAPGVQDTLDPAAIRAHAGHLERLRAERAEQEVGSVRP